MTREDFERRVLDVANFIWNDGQNTCSGIAISGPMMCMDEELNLTRQLLTHAREKAMCTFDRHGVVYDVVIRDRHVDLVRHEPWGRDNISSCPFIAHRGYSYQDAEIRHANAADPLWRAGIIDEVQGAANGLFFGLYRDHTVFWSIKPQHVLIPYHVEIPGLDGGMRTICFLSTNNGIEEAVRIKKRIEQERGLYMQRV